MSFITKNIEQLVDRIRSLTRKYIKKRLDSLGDLDRLSDLVSKCDELLATRIRDCRWERIEERAYHKKMSVTNDNRYAKKEELLRGKQYIKSLISELREIRTAYKLIETEPNMFIEMYNRFFPKDDRDTPNPMDEIEERIDPYKLVQLTL